MKTKSTNLAGTQLAGWLTATGAKKIFLVMDCCHAAGFDPDVKDDIEGDLAALLGGSGTAVLCACEAKATTPGSSPLTKSFRNVLTNLRKSGSSGGVELDPLTIKNHVKASLPSSKMVISSDFHNFALQPAWLQSTCVLPACSMRGKIQRTPLPFGTHNILQLAAEIPCGECGTAMAVSSVVFNSCKWQVSSTWIERTKDWLGNITSESIEAEQTPLRDSASVQIWKRTRPDCTSIFVRIDNSLN